MIQCQSPGERTWDSVHFLLENSLFDPMSRREDLQLGPLSGLLAMLCIPFLFFFESEVVNSVFLLFFSFPNAEILDTMYGRSFPRN